MADDEAPDFTPDLTDEEVLGAILPEQEPPAKPKKKAPRKKRETVQVELSESIFDSVKREAQVRDTNASKLIEQLLREALFPFEQDKQSDGLCLHCGCRDIHSESCPRYRRRPRPTVSAESVRVS